MTTGEQTDELEPSRVLVLLDQARKILEGDDPDAMASVLRLMVDQLEPKADLDTPLTGRNRWEFYQDEQKKYRWRCKDVNGEILFASTQGYFKSGAAKDCAARAGWCNGNGTTTGLY